MGKITVYRLKLTYCRKLLFYSANILQFAIQTKYLSRKLSQNYVIKHIFDKNNRSSKEEVVWE
jgi:3-deoxy-D-manno-octulosonic acid (KDO) 8-phosphate synthase